MLRKISTSFLSAVFVIAALAFSAHPAAAGTNGQQLRLDITCSYAPVMAEIKVSGYNQNGDYVTWYASPNAKGVNTSNWWWVGKVTIDYKFAGINSYTGYPFSWYETYADIPQQFNRDTYPVALDWDQDCSPVWTQ
jgi:hypothetical protein